MCLSFKWSLFDLPFRKENDCETKKFVWIPTGQVNICTGQVNICTDRKESRTSLVNKLQPYQ